MTKVHGTTIVHEKGIIQSVIEFEHEGKTLTTVVVDDLNNYNPAIAELINTAEYQIAVQNAIQKKIESLNDIIL